MSGLIIAALVLACIAAYLLAGWHLAMKQLPQSREHACQTWTTEEYRRTSVREQTTGLIFFWLLIMPFRVARGRLDEAIDGRDPAVLAAKVAEKDRYIAQLEREAGIRR